jgi:urease accessory protein
MTYLSQLRLMQLSDSALPIGSTAHSFGLETLVAHGELTVTDLPQFLADYLIEVGRMEGLFCRLAYRLPPQTDFITNWLQLNARLSAFKLARESRAASAILGKRFLQLVVSLEADPQLTHALNEAITTKTEIHHATAFGLVGAILDSAEELTVLTYLQQNVACLVSACQRLLPLGQKQAAHLLWQLKPLIMKATAQSEVVDFESAAMYTFTPFLDLASMQHPILATRLFIS